MSHSPPPPSANQAASALLHLGLTLTAVLATFSLVGQFGPQLHLGNAVLYVTTIVGALLILRSLVRLYLQTTAALPASSSRRDLKNPIGISPLKSQART